MSNSELTALNSRPFEYEPGRQMFFSLNPYEKMEPGQRWFATRVDLIGDTGPEATISVNLEGDRLPRPLYTFYSNPAPHIAPVLARLDELHFIYPYISNDGEEIFPQRKVGMHVHLSRVFFLTKEALDLFPVEVPRNWVNPYL